MYGFILVNFRISIGKALPTATTGERQPPGFADRQAVSAGQLAGMRTLFLVSLILAGLLVGINAAGCRSMTVRALKELACSFHLS